VLPLGWKRSLTGSDDGVVEIGGEAVVANVVVEGVVELHHVVVPFAPANEPRHQSTDGDVRRIRELVKLLFRKAVASFVVRWDPLARGCRPVALPAGTRLGLPIAAVAGGT
jgi:hypothetical protein